MTEREVEVPSAEVLRADGLTRHFKIGGALSRQTLHAVDDVTFSIGRREIVALAGESGSGKSTIARLLARIYQPTSGVITYEGKPLSALRSRRDRLRARGRHHPQPQSRTLHRARSSLYLL